MKGVPSEYMSTKAEIQNAVLDWVRATEEFHFYYLRIGEVLKSLPFNAHPGSTVAVSTNHSRRARRLLQLRKHMKDVLETLLFHMSKPKQSSYGGSESVHASKPSQLAAHAQLLREINQNACEELTQFSTSLA